MKLQILGTRGPELWDKDASVSYLIWLDDKARLMIDAGPGSSQNFEISGAKFEELEVMLFTHFHADHSADFMAYAKGGYFTERVQDLMIIGPSGNKLVVSADEFIERSIGDKGLYPYLSDFVNKDDPSEYKIRSKTLPWTDEDPQITTVYISPDDKIIVKAVPTKHGPIPSFAYRVEAAGCVVVFTGDMNGSLGMVPELAEKANILVAHNAIPETQTGVAARLHMKPSYIGRMAEKARVRKLVLTHLMRRSEEKKKETLEIIRDVYKGGVFFPHDLEAYMLKPKGFSLKGSSIN